MKNILHHDITQLTLYIYHQNFAQLPPNWKHLKTFENKKTGFYAEVFQQGEIIVYAIRGTDMNEGGDWYDDSLLGRNKKPEQYQFAEMYFKVVEEFCKNNDYKLIIAGYSLGGALAQMLGTKYGHETVTLGAYGAKGNKGTEKKHEDNIYNYGKIDDGIFTLNANNHIGKAIILDKADSKNSKAYSKDMELPAFHTRTLQNHMPEAYADKALTEVGEYKPRNIHSQPTRRGSLGDAVEEIKSKSRYERTAKNNENIKQTVAKIVKAPETLKNITKKEAQELISKIAQEYHEDKETVQNFLALVEDSAGMAKHRVTTAQKAQAKIAKELAQKTQNKVFEKAGISKRYIKEHIEKIQGHKKTTAQKNQTFEQDKQRQIIETFKPAVKAKRLIEESMADYQQKKQSEKNKHEKRWFDRELSELPDPTRKRTDSFNVIEKLPDITENSYHEETKKKKWYQEKDNLLILAQILENLLENIGGDYEPPSPSPSPSPAPTPAPSPSPAPAPAPVPSPTFNAKLLADGFVNPILKSAKIFTSEDIDSMSNKEYLKNKEAINYQKKNIVSRQNHKQRKKLQKADL